VGRERGRPLSRKAIWGVAAVAAAALVVVLVRNPFSDTPSGPAISGALFGAFVQPGPSTGPDRRAAVTSFESSIGRSLAVERIYYR